MYYTYYINTYVYVINCVYIYIYILITIMIMIIMIIFRRARSVTFFVALDGMKGFGVIASTGRAENKNRGEGLLLIE